MSEPIVVITQAEQWHRTPGVCATCGSEEIEYDHSDIDGDSLAYRYYCECGASGREYHNLVFAENVPD